MSVGFAVVSDGAWVSDQALDDLGLDDGLDAVAGVADDLGGRRAGRRQVNKLRSERNDRVGNADRGHSAAEGSLRGDQRGAKGCSKTAANVSKKSVIDSALNPIESYLVIMESRLTK